MTGFRAFSIPSVALVDADLRAAWENPNAGGVHLKENGALRAEQYPSRPEVAIHQPSWSARRNHFKLL
jgi:hypothetical protein